MSLAASLLLLVVLFYSPSLSEISKPNAPYSNWIKELHKELFQIRKYEKEVRPILDPNERTVVDFQFSFTRIVVNEKEGILETNGWLGLRWVDHMMIWDPSDFGDLRNLKLISDLLWKPDIVVFNSVRGYEPLPPTQIILLYDGVVYYIPPLYLVTPCDLDLKLWPHGLQKCEIRFVAWTYDSSEILLSILDNQTMADLKHYAPGNLQWSIAEATVTTNSHLNCCNPYYQDVIVTILLNRKSSTEETMVIVSSAVIWVLVEITYWMKVDSTHRTIIGYFGFLSMILITIYFCWKLPIGKSFPIVAIIHIILLILCGLNCGITMINGSIIRRSEPIPSWFFRLMRSQVAECIISNALPDLSQKRTVQSEQPFQMSILSPEAYTESRSNNSNTLSSTPIPSNMFGVTNYKHKMVCKMCDPTRQLWYSVTIMIDRLAFSTSILIALAAGGIIFAIY